MIAGGNGMAVTTTFTSRSIIPSSLSTNISPYSLSSISWSLPSSSQTSQQKDTSTNTSTTDSNAVKLSNPPLLLPPRSDSRDSSVNGGYSFSIGSMNSQGGKISPNFLDGFSYSWSHDGDLKSGDDYDEKKDGNKDNDVDNVNDEKGEIERKQNKDGNQSN